MFPSIRCSTRSHDVAHAKQYLVACRLNQATCGAHESSVCKVATTYLSTAIHSMFYSIIFGINVDVTTCWITNNYLIRACFFMCLCIIIYLIREKKV